MYPVIARPPVFVGAVQFNVRLEPFVVTDGAVLPGVTIPDEL